MINFESESIKFKFKEKEYSISVPTVKQLLDFEKVYTGESSQVLDYIAGLGVEREVLESLQLSHLKVLMEKVNSKKN